MKKSYLGGVLLLVPALLLTGCGGGTNTLSISANWYRDTGLSDQISQTYEKLEYTVAFQPAETNNEFKAEYGAGTYTAELKSERRALSDGTQELLYVLSTSFEISGKFILNGSASEQFTDTIECTTVFHNARAQLKPVRSEKTIKSHAPNSQTPSTLESAFSSYHYSLITEYTDTLDSLKTTYTDLSKEDAEPIENEYKIDVNGTYLDNEEILFALRGLNLASSNFFYSFNSSKRAIEPLTTGTAESEDLLVKSLSIDGGEAAETTIPCYKVALGYQSSTPGNTQTLWYAKTVNPTANTYRNVLAYMEVPVMYNLGTLCYTLKAAQFTTK